MTLLQLNPFFPHRLLCGFPMKKNEKEVFLNLKSESASETSNSDQCPRETSRRRLITSKEEEKKNRADL